VQMWIDRQERMRIGQKEEMRIGLKEGIELVGWKEWKLVKQKIFKGEGGESQFSIRVGGKFQFCIWIGVE